MQKLDRLKIKVFDANKEIELIKIEANKSLEPYNERISVLEKECLELLKQIDEEENKILK